MPLSFNALMKILLKKDKGKCRNVRGLGKSMAVFRLFENKGFFLESISPIELYGGVKWQNGSSSVSTRIQG